MRAFIRYMLVLVLFWTGFFLLQQFCFLYFHPGALKGIAADAVLTCLLSCSDEHLLARGAFLPYSHPDAGSGRTTRPPWRMHRRPATTVNAAPRFGEHSHDVLTRVGGYSDAEVHALVASNVVTADLIAGAAG